MGLKGDYEEVRNNFSKASLLGKLLQAILLFLAVSSIASMADVVFQWKGFIFRSLGAYRDYFVVPLARLSSPFGLQYQEQEIHAAVFVSVSVIIGMAILAEGQKVAFQRISELYNNEVKPSLLFFRVIGTIFPIAVWLWYGFSSQDPNLWFIGAMFLLYPAFIVGPKIILSKLGRGEFFERGSYSYFLNYYAYVAAVLLVVAVLAAINSGITRST